MHKKTLLAPAQLWIGNTDHMLDAATKELQEIFCSHNGCGSCMTCQNIRRREHYAIRWLTPESNGYTVQQLEEIIATITLQLDHQQHFFFIIEHADMLSQSGANKLLKPIEEPPAGYHFILLTTTKDSILPTIRSRCLERYFIAEANESPSELMNILTADQYNASEFLKALDRAQLNEQASRQLLDELYTYWTKRFLTTQDTALKNKIVIIEKALLHQPMPGSSTLFWKNIFLQLHA